MSELLSFVADDLGAVLASRWQDIVSYCAWLYVVGLIAFFIEKIRPAQRESKFFKTDFKTAICYPLADVVCFRFIGGFIVAVVTTYAVTPYIPYQIFSAEIIHLPYVVQLCLAAVLMDFSIYAEHRFAHRFMWPFHAIHHMTPEVSWITHLRVHPVNGISIRLFRTLALHILGFEGEAIVQVAFVVVLISIYEHVNLDFGYPAPLSYLFVSPNFHRWHHAKDEAARDKNFCLVFPFIDLMFGTYYLPDGAPPK